DHPRRVIGLHRGFIGEPSGRGPVGRSRLSAFLVLRPTRIASSGDQPMSTQTSTLAQPLRSRSEAPGSIYIPTARPAQPRRQSQPKGRQRMSGFVRERIYGLFTAIAICGLLSPLAVASLTFAGPSI